MHSCADCGYKNSISLHNDGRKMWCRRLMWTGLSCPVGLACLGLWAEKPMADQFGGRYFAISHGWIRSSTPIQHDAIRFASATEPLRE
jgi:hypothetical protein